MTTVRKWSVNDVALIILILSLTNGMKKFDAIVLHVITSGSLSVNSVDLDLIRISS